ncbi:MAG: outer membrane beta-barrel protein [Spongiibacteraceae bacterium]
MKLRHASKVSGLLVLAVVASPFAAAEGSGWYLGANAGQSRGEIDNEEIRNSLLSAGFISTSIDDDERDTGYKLFGGYQFNRYFALEGGYFNLGQFDFRADTLPAGGLRGDIELQGVNLDAVGILPLTDKFSVFGRVGANYAEAEDSFRGSGAVNVSDPSSTERKTNYKYGAGLQYAFTDAMAMRVEAERYRIDNARGEAGDVDLFSVGLLYRFGQTKPAPVAYVAPPEPVAPPPPAPLPPPPPRKVAFSADSLFDFNKQDVKPAGRQALDAFATELKGTQFEVITVTGHTDRIGSHDYNMKLSTRRAEAVKAYLVESLGIPSSKVEARGVNGAEPVTQPGDCQGEKATQQLIACLQPDRRVEIEVSGTRK